MSRKFVNKRKTPVRIKLPGESVWDQIPNWGFMKQLKCAKITAFENGSTLITGTIPSKGEAK
jgi:hypothetical protein